MFWVKESYYRGPALEASARTLPADIYNATRWLLARAEKGSAFVPIRNMQYLAVIDAEEIVFVDGLGARTIELAWRDFQPRTRTSLTDPVPYACVVYEPKARETVLRLQGEFTLAIKQLQTRMRDRDHGQIIGDLVPFRR